MAKGKKLRRSRLKKLKDPNNLCDSLYEEVEDPDLEEAERSPLSRACDSIAQVPADFASSVYNLPSTVVNSAGDLANIASTYVSDFLYKRFFDVHAYRTQKMRSELMEENADANWDSYNQTFRDRIEARTAYVPYDDDVRFAQQYEGLSDLEFQKDLDHAFTEFDQELARLINQNGASHVEIDRLKEAFIAKQRETLETYRDEHPVSWWRHAKMDPQTVERAFQDASDNYLIELTRDLDRRISDTRVLQADLCVLAPGETIEAFDATGAVGNVDLSAIESLEKQYQRDLFTAMTSLDNDPRNIRDVTAIHDAYQNALQQKVAALASSHPGMIVKVNSSSSVTDGQGNVHQETHQTDLSAHLQQRFADIRMHTQALRSEMNQQFMAPKSTLQQWRYRFDHDTQRQTDYQKITVGKADEFKIDAEKCRTAIEKLLPTVTPAPTEYHATVMVKPALEASQNAISFDDHLGALQSRLATLDQAYRSGEGDAAGHSAEAQAISSELTTLRKSLSTVPDKYTLMTADAVPAEADLTANSFVQVIQKDAEPELYFIDANNVSHLCNIDDKQQRQALLARFPNQGLSSVTATLAEVGMHADEAAKQAIRVDSVMSEVNAVNEAAYCYGHVKTFADISTKLTQLHSDYAAAIRPLLDIEYRFDRASAKEQLKRLKQHYEGLCQQQLGALQAFQTSLAPPPPAKPELPQKTLDSFNEQCDALRQAQQKNFEALVKETNEKREAADVAFENFSRNYQWDAYQRDPYDRDRHRRLDDKEIERISKINPIEELNRLKASDLNSSMQLGAIRIKKDSEGGYSLILSDAFSGEGHYSRDGKVTTLTALKMWFNKGKRTRDIEATLTDPGRLDNLGLVLKTIMKARPKDDANNPRPLRNTCEVYSQNNFNQMLAIYVAAAAQGIPYDIKADFQHSFKTQRRYSVVFSVSERTRNREMHRMIREVEKRVAQQRDTVALNAACRDLTLHGTLPGVASAEAQQVINDIKDRNSRDFAKAVSALSHAGSSLRARSGKNPDVADIQASLQHLKNLNLSLVKGIVPTGGDYNGRSAALLGVALERDHYAALLVLKQLELSAVVKTINELPPNDPQVSSLRVACATVQQTLKVEQQHFEQLCKQYGCTADQIGQTIYEQMAMQQEIAKSRDMTVSGNDKIKAVEIAAGVEKNCTDSTLTFESQFQALHQLAAVLSDIEISHASARSTTTASEKTLLEHFVTSEQLRDPLAFIHDTDFTERANSVEARLQATREEMREIESEHQQAITDAESHLNRLTAPDSNASAEDQQAAQQHLHALKKQSTGDYLQATLLAEQSKTPADLKDTAKIEKLERLQAHQAQVQPLQTARDALASAQAERAKLGANAKPDAIAAAENKLTAAQESLRQLEAKIQALDLPKTLDAVRASLANSKKALASQVQHYQQDIKQRLGKAETALNPSPETSDKDKFDAARQVIKELSPVQTIVLEPQQRKQHRELLTQAKTECASILEQTAKSVVGLLKSDQQSLDATVKKLEEAAHILSQSDPHSRSDAASSNLALARDCQERAAVLKEVKPFVESYEKSLGEITASGRCEDFAQRSNTFNDAAQSNQAKTQLLSLSKLKENIEKQLATVKDPLAKKLLTNMHAKVEAYRVALVSDLTKDAVCVLALPPNTHADREQLNRVKQVFSATGADGKPLLTKAEQTLASEHRPTSHALAAIKEKLAPSTIMQQVDAKLAAPAVVQSETEMTQPTSPRRSS